VRGVWTDKHARIVIALTVVFATVYSTVGLILHLGHRTALFDLGMYEQAMQGYARFSLPRVPCFGVLSAEDPGILHWADHFTPILALLTPFYWIHRGPETLLVAQGILFALAIPPVWVFTRRALGPAAAYAVAVAFGLSWAIQEAIWFPFHQVAFAVPIMALMVERYQAGKLRQAAWASLALLTIREDLGLVVSALGLLVFLKGERRLGIKLMLGGVAATWLLTSVVIPLAGGSPRRNWTYGHLGDGPLELAWAVLKSPLSSLEYALSPREKVRTLLWLFGPLFFLPARSRVVLLALPLLAVRMLSSEERHYSMHYHYNAFVVVFLFCAGVDAAAALPEIRLRWRALRVPSGILWAFAICGVAVLTLPRTPGWKLTQRAFWYPRTANTRAAAEALAEIPSGAFVAASNTLGVHLTPRAKVVLLVPPGDPYEQEGVWKLEGLTWKYLGTRHRAEAPWIALNLTRQEFPFHTVEQQRALVGTLQSKGYSLVHDADGYVVLHRPDGSERAQAQD
jgi:uncharacterized membrane protein